VTGNQSVDSVFVFEKRWFRVLGFVGECMVIGRLVANHDRRSSGSRIYRPKHIGDPAVSSCIPVHIVVDVVASR
jgi:hypothetical protein